MIIYDPVFYLPKIKKFSANYFLHFIMRFSFASWRQKIWKDPETIPSIVFFTLDYSSRNALENSFLR